MLLTVPRKNFISASLVSDERIFAVPAIPLGFAPSAKAKIRKESLIHDKLELGVTTMTLNLVKLR